MLRVRYDSNKPLVFLFLGSSGVGKCFGFNTRLRLHSGDSIAVQDIKGGEQLMGDDGHPRTVVRGSLTQGWAPLYRVSPHWSGAEPFTVNGDHILVLANTSMPSIARCADTVDAWQLCWFELDTASNEMTQRSQRFHCRQRAEAELTWRQQRWQPLEWEVSVKEFMRAPACVRSACHLFQSGAVTFQSSLPPLSRVLSLVLGAEASEPQLRWAAWFVGLWLSYALSDQHGVEQGTEVASAPSINARLVQGRQLFGADDGDSSVTQRLLAAYGLLHNPHVPQAWLCDTEEVRRSILAGIMDGQGCGSSQAGRHGFSITTDKQEVAAGCKLLAGSLGIRSSSIRWCRRRSSSSSTPAVCYRLYLSHGMQRVLPLCAVPVHCPPALLCDDAAAALSARCFDFSISALPAGDYYGFGVKGNNRRFLLADFTVTHNVGSVPSPESSDSSRLSLAPASQLLTAVLCAAALV